MSTFTLRSEYKKQGELLIKPALAVLDQALISASSFVTVVLLARNLNPAETGAYVTLIALLMLFTGFSAALVLTPFKVLYGHRREATYQPQAALLVVLVVAGTLGFTLVLRLGLGFGLDIVVPVLATYALLQGHEFARAQLLMQERLAVLLGLDLTTHGLRLVTLALLLTLGNETLAHVLWALPMSLLPWLMWTLAGQRKRQLRLRILPRVRSQALRSWRYGRWLLADSLAYSAASHLVIIIAALRLSASDIAGLGVSINLVNSTNLLFMGIAAYTLPVASRLYRERALASWRRLLVTNTVLSSTLVILVLSLIWWLHGPLITLLYGSHFSPYAHLVPWLIPAALLTCLCSFLQVRFLSSQRPQVAFRAKLAGAVVSLFWLPVGLHWLQLQGAVIALVLAPTVWMLVYLSAVQREPQLSDG